MPEEKKPRFKNIVLQDEDGTAHMYEPEAKGLSVILLILQEEENNQAHVKVRSAYTLKAAATLIHVFLKSNHAVAAELVAITTAELVDLMTAAEQTKGGMTN